jgi:hypothetical protein
MDTKITLLVTGLILVVVTATIASSVRPVYAPGGKCAGCGQILVTGHNLIISSQARLAQAFSALRGAIESQQQNPTGQSPN